MTTPARYLVTGGAGFIGSHLASKLLDDGHDVVVLDDLSSGKRENLDDLEGDRLTFIEGSILDDEALGRAINGVEAVFHQAAIPSVTRSFANPAATLRANVEGTARVLEACRKNDIRRVVVASSSSVYGDTLTLPKEEGMTPAPLSPYAQSKLTGEALCQIYAREYGFAVASLRYFNIFGPRQDPTSQYAAVVPRFITALLAGKPPTVYGDGKQSRDFTYIDNVVAANLLAAGVGEGSRDDHVGANEEAAGDLQADENRAGRASVMNIACGERFTVLELIATLNRLIGTDIEPEFTPPRPGDVRHSHAAIERARAEIGYEPLVGFEEGLRRTVDWFRSQ